ncbi:hypothetical protein BFN03_17265 [Rhodococcus sp. WMMA185]|nr:hypothetical protein BFN03_17265 [Rhodococcus sp. WMMA185]
MQGSRAGEPLRGDGAVEDLGVEGLAGAPVLAAEANPGHWEEFDGWVAAAPAVRPALAVADEVVAEVGDCRRSSA